MNAKKISEEINKEHLEYVKKERDRIFNRGKKEIRLGEKKLISFLATEHNQNFINSDMVKHQLLERVHEIDKENTRMVTGANKFDGIKFELERNMETQKLLREFVDILQGIKNGHRSIEYSKEYYERCINGD